ncbi:UvrD-helicase domain-containing protein [Salinibacterium sp. NK8237]|uniref:UvrD-helicase domain-containing protein n=1 Tax=Salinibacterium sp. NK8237 TaxID=2792038 RepID=UPI0018CDE5BA|nr:UvrD-helicase domain-containing protein [Salinibacterium sp. NK8237]MBH0129562.1 AAA family ATPase [Salinibacterium sp. NK8237]
MDLEASAENLLNEAPCSLEMPAGTGKTHLLAASVRAASKLGMRSLILTHTNAGVDVLRTRLKKMKVGRPAFHVDTITSWAFQLLRAYGTLGGIAVPSIPDWSDSGKYIDGATRVVNSKAIREMHSHSFGAFFVDEYQDCSERQHAFIRSICTAIPKTIVFGDRLQGIFGFSDTLVDWDAEVFDDFPLKTMEYEPHRWAETNPELGRWLLDLRPSLVSGGVFDLTSVKVPGLRFVSSGQGALGAVAHANRNFEESVVLLDKWRPDAAAHASRLGGSFSVMEDIGGRFMAEHLSSFPEPSSHLMAYWLANFAKACCIGLGGIDSAVLGKLRSNESVTHYKRDGLDSALEHLDLLRRQPSFDELAKAARGIVADSKAKVYRWEAWRDTLESIRATSEGGAAPLVELGLIRDRIRHTGRVHGTRVASTTLLVKGLEYDHVIIANLAKFEDPRNLYVALTRARKSVTIIGVSARMGLRNG